MSANESPQDDLSSPEPPSVPTSPSEGVPVRKPVSCWAVIGWILLISGAAILVLGGVCVLILFGLSR